MPDPNNGQNAKPQSPTPTQSSWTSSVSPSDKGGTSSNTLTMVECNDCTLSRLVECLKQDSRIELPKGYTFPGSYFTEKPLALNIVGLRIKNSVSNKFDDRMVIFYRPIDLEGPSKVHEPESHPDLNVPEIEAFLKSTPGGLLKVANNELPGKPSVNTDKKECKLHAGWKILKYSITTDPGYQKKPDASKDVPVGGGSDAYLAQGRASLRSGRHNGSHHVGLHHGSKMNGFTAMTQVGNVTVLRGYTGKVLIAKVKEAEKKWGDAYKAYKKKTKTPLAEDAWVPTYLTDLIGKVQDVRQENLSGTVVGTSVTADYTMTSEVKDPTKPDVKTWTLTVKGLKTGERAVADTDVIVSPSTGVFGINLHSSNPDPANPNAPSYDPNVYNWSEGCQVFKGMADFKQFRSTCELSKHAICPRRKSSASSACPSMKEKITLEDVLYIHFANNDEMKAYTSTRLTASAADRTTAADAMLRTKVTGDAKDDNFVEGIQGRVDAMDFNESPNSGAASSPAPKLSASKTAASARATAVNDVVKAHLLPNAADDAIRKQISTSALVKKLETYMQADLSNDPSLKTMIETKAATKKTTAEKKAVLADAEVVALQSTQEAAIQKKKLDKLATQLDSLTKEMEDRIAWTMKDIKQKREKKRDQWNDEGYELCDMLWKCEQKVDYVLAEVDKAFVEEVDKRY